jgi:hypothetical protein
VPFLIGAIILIFLIGAFSSSGNPLRNLSQNARVGVFCLILGLIFRFIATISAVYTTEMYGSPGITYSLLSGISTLAFAVTICSLVIGLYRMFFK